MRARLPTLSLPPTHPTCSGSLNENGGAFCQASNWAHHLNLFSHPHRLVRIKRSVTLPPTILLRAHRGPSSSPFAGSKATGGKARRVLAAEVGLEPSGELRLLEQRILEQDPVLDTLGAFEPEVALATTAERNPCKGLRAFEEADAADFYGREALVRRLREALERRAGARLVVLAGPSGSGKSSVVGAGLIPILRADRWSIATMYPGGAPMGALAAAVDLLEAQPRSLLSVDQLEELITLAPVGSQEEFLDRLAELAAGPDGPWVVVTVRADFLDQLLVHSRFVRLVEPGLLLVTPLEDHEVRDVIVGPASRVGVTVEPDLAAAMVRDVAHRAPTLPQLEYALTDLRPGERRAVDA